MLTNIENLWLDHPDVTLFALSAIGGTIALKAMKTTKREKPANSGRTQKISRTERAMIRQKFAASKIPKDIDTIIIGSGMGGLSCAAILSRLGKKVLVLEQHEDVAGGGTHQFDLGGYRFDSGLHYTVPWSEPVFALTCLKGVDEVCQFKLMGDEHDVVDKIYLHPVAGDSSSRHHPVKPFDMVMYEGYKQRLYEEFPEEKDAIDQYMVLSDVGMLYVKLFLFARLLPRWMQDWFWKLVPHSVVASAATTAEGLLPKLTSNKRLISLLTSMWIDTGARPDMASFMLTASVFRGISMEGGCYPADGAEAMAIELARVITQHGGSILIRAQVEEICAERSTGVTGVRVRDAKGSGDLITIPCKRVVSSAGYSNTFGKLVSERVTKEFGIPRSLKVKQSAGFVMANIGIKGTPEELGICDTNTWHIPVDEANQDGFQPMRAFFDNPLRGACELIPAFITFPSVKDKAWSGIETNKGKVSCQMLMMAEFDWFVKYREAADAARKSAGAGAKGSSGTASAHEDVLVQEYEELKAQWGKLAVELLTMYYPKVAGKVDFMDVSTPLTIENYLHADRGGAVGIDVTPERFVDADVRRRLDCVTDVPGLYMTGQDTVICGVTLCQISGVITAFRMEGFCAGASILAQSICRDIATNLGLR